jgi:O-antigen ligase
MLRVGNAYIDPNEYADAFVFPIAITMMLALRSNWLIVKLCGIGLVGAMTTAMVLSGSREGLVCLVLLAFYYIWRSRYRLQLALASAVVSLAVLPFTGTLFARFQTALSTGGQGRTSIWAVGLTAAKHYGLWGSGIGTFPDAYNRFYLSVAQIYTYGWNAPPHNLVLHFWVELGIIGLGILIWFFIANFTMLRAITKDHPLYDYRIMIEGGLIGVCTASFFVDTFNTKWVWLVFATATQLVYLASTYRRPPLEPA